MISINESNLLITLFISKPFNKIKENIELIKSKKGISFFIALLLTFIGFIIADNPIIKNIFTIQLPITLESATSELELEILLKEIAISGAHVPIDTKDVAIIILGIFNLIAKLLIELISIFEDIIIIINPISKRKKLIIKSPLLLCGSV